MIESFVLFYLHTNKRKIISFTLQLDFCWGFGGGVFLSFQDNFWQVLDIHCEHHTVP